MTYETLNKTVKIKNKSFNEKLVLDNLCFLLNSVNCEQGRRIEELSENKLSNKEIKLEICNIAQNWPNKIVLKDY
jgi:hypothetical protein